MSILVSLLLYPEYGTHNWLRHFLMFPAGLPKEALRAYRWLCLPFSAGGVFFFPFTHTLAFELTYFASTSESSLLCVPHHSLDFCFGHQLSGHQLLWTSLSDWHRLLCPPKQKPYALAHPNINQTNPPSFFFSFPTAGGRQTTRQTELTQPPDPLPTTQLQQQGIFARERSVQAHHTPHALSALVFLSHPIPSLQPFNQSSLLPFLMQIS